MEVQREFRRLDLGQLKRLPQQEGLLTAAFLLRDRRQLSLVVILILAMDHKYRYTDMDTAATEVDPIRIFPLGIHIPSTSTRPHRMARLLLLGGIPMPLLILIRRDTTVPLVFTVLLLLAINQPRTPRRLVPALPLP